MIIIFTIRQNRSYTYNFKGQLSKVMENTEVVLD